MRMSHAARALLLGCLVQAAVSADAQRLASKDDAYITRDKAGDSWTIGTDATALTVGFDRAGSYGILAMTDPASGRDWAIGPAPDSSLTIGDGPLALGSRSAGFVLRNSEATVTDTGVRLALTFELRSPRILVTRYYAAVPRVAIIETWTTLEVPAGTEAVNVADLNAFDVLAPAGALRWLTGLQVSPEEGGGFTMHRRDLAPGEVAQFGAQDRSSETYVPWLGIEVSGGRFFGGIMWSGAWAASVTRGDGQMRMQMGLSGMSTEVRQGQTLEMPHGFFGATTGDDANMSAALRAFIVRGIRGGRPFEPSVVYNTWFTYGTRIDDAVIREEIDRNAALGTEVFVVDAGWYRGAAGIFDFTSGLGSWEVDEDRFPEGLASLADYARSRGMRFGLWVEPGHTSLDLVDRPGLARAGVAGDPRRPVRSGPDRRGNHLGTDLPGRLARTAVGDRSPRPAHRGGPAGLPEVGQQSLGVLQPGRSRPRRVGRQLPAGRGLLPGAGGSAGAVPEPDRRERLGRRQPPRPRPAPVQ